MLRVLLLALGRIQVSSAVVHNFSSHNPGLDNASDLEPEGLIFIPASENSIYNPLLVVANEVSRTITICEITRVN